MMYSVSSHAVFEQEPACTVQKLVSASIKICKIREISGRPVIRIVVHSYFDPRILYSWVWHSEMNKTLGHIMKENGCQSLRKMFDVMGYGLA